jgi:hypothetical protein
MFTVALATLHRLVVAAPGDPVVILVETPVVRVLVNVAEQLHREPILQRVRPIVLVPRPTDHVHQHPRDTRARPSVDLACVVASIAVEKLGRLGVVF